MAWTIAIVIAVLGLSFILLFLNNAFEKSKQGIKVFLVMLTLGTLVVLSQIIHLIVKDKATGDTLTHLSTLSVTTLTITITLLSFFTMFFLIFYTRGILRSIRDAKHREKTKDFGDI